MKKVTYTICTTDKGLNQMKPIASCKNEDTTVKVVSGLNKNVKNKFFIVET